MKAAGRAMEIHVNIPSALPKKLLFTSPNLYSEELQNMKDEHYCNLPF